MKKLITSIASVATVLVPVMAQADTYKVAHAFGETGIQGQVDQYFTDLISAATNGDLEFQYFWGGSLGAGNEIVHLIRDGAIQAGVSAPAYYGSEMPISGLTNGTPFLFSDISIAMDLQDNLSRTNAHFLAEYKRMGVFPILQHGLTPSHLMCTKPVTKFDDLSGLKVRTFGYYLPAAMESLGMVPVSLALSDTYEGLQRGVIDCAAVSYSTAKAFKLHEVATNWSDINLGAASGPAFYVSWADYKEGGWSSEVIAIVDDAAKKAMSREKAIADEGDKNALQDSIASGVSFVEFADQAKVDATVPDILGLWRELQIKNGMEEAVADEIVDVIAAAKAGN